MICIMFGTYLTKLDPGYLKTVQKYDEDAFLRLLIRNDPSTLCPDCKVVRTMRSRHCYVCDQCVDVFDHHCPWIDNCVGGNNFRPFYAFILLQLSYLILTTYLIAQNLLSAPSSLANLTHLSCISDILIFTLSIFFLLSLLVLCCIQTTNILYEQTTCERYSK